MAVACAIMSASSGGVYWFAIVLAAIAYGVDIVGMLNVLMSRLPRRVR